MKSFTIRTTFGFFSANKLTSRETETNLKKNKWPIKIAGLYNKAVTPFLEFSVLQLQCCTFISHLVSSQILFLLNKTYGTHYHWWEETRKPGPTSRADSWQVYTGSRGSWCNSSDESADDESIQPGHECRHLVSTLRRLTHRLAQRGGALWANPFGHLLLLCRANWCVTGMLEKDNVPILKESTWR